MRNKKACIDSTKLYKQCVLYSLHNRMNLIKLNIKKPTQPNFIKGHKIEQKGLKTINIRDLKIFF